MKIGLVRHFKVDAPVYKHPINSKEFAKSQEVYHQSDIVPKDVNLNGIEWQKCYCSTLPRAQKTANRIFDGSTIYSEKLVEVELSPPFQSNIKLSFNLWVIVARFAWLFGHTSQIESRKNTTQRCRMILDLLEADDNDNILIVSHGFFLHEFAKYLKKNAFKGEIDFAPENGKLYIFEK
jgi:broad specificity phosphatase PhoE